MSIAPVIAEESLEPTASRGADEVARTGDGATKVARRLISEVPPREYHELAVRGLAAAIDAELHSRRIREMNADSNQQVLLERVRMAEARRLADVERRRQDESWGAFGLHLDACPICRKAWEWEQRQRAHRNNARWPWGLTTVVEGHEYVSGHPCPPQSRASNGAHKDHRGTGELCPEPEFPHLRRPTIRAKLCPDGNAILTDELVESFQDERISRQNGHAYKYAENQMTRSIERQAVEKLRAIMYMGADGREKSLLDFDINDIAANEGRAAKMETAWRKRRHWFSDAKDALIHHGAARVSALPADTLLDLGEKAQKVWS